MPAFGQSPRNGFGDFGRKRAGDHEDEMAGPNRKFVATGANAEPFVPRRFGAPQKMAAEPAPFQRPVPSKPMPGMLINEVSGAISVLWLRSCSLSE
jgi:hypothetical protein